MKGLEKWISKNHTQLQAQADEHSLPWPDMIEVHLREGKHPKTGARQWQGTYAHGSDRRKVVCQPLHAELLPDAGERWKISLHTRSWAVAGMIFGSADTSIEFEKLSKRPEHEVVISSLACHRHRGYFSDWVYDWDVHATLIGTRVPVEIEVPKGTEIPQPGEAWRVRTQRSHSGHALRAEAVARISEPAARPIPTDEFVVFFPDHNNNGDPLEYNGWKLKYEGWNVGHYRCHFAAMEGDALLIKVIGVSLDPTEAWIAKKLVVGKRISIRFPDYEEAGCDDFGYDGSLLEVESWNGDEGVDLQLTLKTPGGGHEHIMVNHAIVVGDCLLATCQLSKHTPEEERCYVEVH